MSNPSRLSRIHRYMVSIPPAGCRLAAPLALLILAAMSASAQQQPQPPEPKPEAPQAEPAKQNPLGPLGPPPSTATTYAKDVVFEVRYWVTRSTPLVRQSGGDAASNFSFKDELGGSNRNNRPWIILGIPTGHGNRLWVSYFDTTFSGGGVSNRTLTFNDQSYDPETLLNDRIKLRNFKLSWEYLTYPAPPHAMKKWQFKTLWEIQAVNIAPTITSTILTTDSEGNVYDSGTTTSKSKLLILPTIGAGIDTQPAKGVNFSVKASGFILPSHKYIYDTEARLGIRVKVAEIVLGYRKLYASAGSGNQQYYRAGLAGPYAGLAWHF